MSGAKFLLFALIFGLMAASAVPGRAEEQVMLPGYPPIWVPKSKISSEPSATLPKPIAGPAETITVAQGTLSDAIIEVHPYDTVTWLTLDHPVTIAFQENGTSAFLASASPTAVKHGKGEPRLWPVITPGGRASLSFIEPGTYIYVVSILKEAGGVPSQQRTLLGRIIVN